MALCVHDIVELFGFVAEIIHESFQDVGGGRIILVVVDLQKTFPGNKVLWKLRQEIMDAADITKDAVTFKNLFPGATFKEPKEEAE